MLAFNHILCPIDFSESSYTALKYAIRFAKKFDARISLLSVVEDVPEYFSRLFEKEEKLYSRLDDLVKQTDWEGLDLPHTAVTDGSPFIKIIQHARDINADLIIIGAHGHEGQFKDVIIGSTAEKVIRKSPCPVLTVHDNAAGSDMIQRVLYPVDLSSTSKSIAADVAFIAETYSARVHILHVLHHPTAMLNEDLIQGIRREASREMELFLSDPVWKNVKLEPEICKGLPSAMILDVATSKKADLIIMTTHGRGIVPHLLIGSTAERVARHAPCSVLTIRPEDAVEFVLP
ncbi:MAG: universal stress protein [Gemmatimonadetes bacterium]|nr:MAG: universal stress protein [Gemmatimonadota bacterium]